MSIDGTQGSYYERTASDYDADHVADGDEHFVALEYIAGLCTTLRADSVLDVGAGTGRGVSFLRTRRPNMSVVGVEPVDALRAKAEEAGVSGLEPGDGTALHYPDDSFDVVIATALMHHVPDPTLVIAEMTRVARKAVMISDINRFGHASLPANVIKVGMKMTGLWEIYMRARTGGKGHLYSEGDGIFYSYSIYDSLPQLAAWGDRAFVIPTRGRSARRYSGSLLTGAFGLLVATKEPPFEGWATP